MNKHILFVKEWLADNECKTQEELVNNSAAADTADTADTADAFTAAVAAYYAMKGDAENAAKSVNRYEKLAHKEG
jgi:hydroxymethylpyrimidine/phosphomethylpyrimidine kinase